MDRLRMPKPNVTKEDIDALTTFLLGSTDPSLTVEYMYKPADQRAAIQRLVDHYEIQLHRLPSG